MTIHRGWTYAELSGEIGYGGDASSIVSTEVHAWKKYDPDADVDSENWKKYNEQFDIVCEIHGCIRGDNMLEIIVEYQQDFHEEAELNFMIQREIKRGKELIIDEMKYHVLSDYVFGDDDDGEFDLEVEAKLAVSRFRDDKHRDED